MYSLKDIRLVPNLATRACGGTVVFPGGSRENIKGLAFYPMPIMYSLEDIQLIPNFATRACDDTVVYPGGSRVNFKGGLFSNPCL